MSAPRAETREYFVPGRVELVGKHVDYAGGRSLTIATELAIHARAAAIDEPVIRLRRAAGEVAMDIALSPGFTIVRGPNEAGKSTIQRGLELALFRKPTAQGADYLDTGLGQSFRRRQSDPNSRKRPGSRR